MMRVTTLYAGSAAATASYYTRYLTKAPGEVPGVWQGAQAAGLGLSGEVSTEALELLLSGRHPSTGAQLGHPLVDRTLATGKVIRAVAGFDATLSAPKSLSAWWALTGDERLAECHDVAVKAVVAHLERFGATTRIRSNGSRLHPDTNGLTVAAFRQTTSRLDDPQLHTHVVVSAKVQTVDGRWLALDARFLKRHQRMLGGLYQSVLRAELTHRYGVGFSDIVTGQAEIAGVPTELLAQFSKRTVEVDAALKSKVAEFSAREGRDPTRWERAVLGREAALDTRGHKTGHGVADLRSRWLQEAADLGITAELLTESIADAARKTPEAEAVKVIDVIDHLSAKSSTWHRADVVRAICDLQRPRPGHDGTRWAAMLEQAADQVLADCVDLDPPTNPNTPRRTSDGRSVWIEPVAAHVTSDMVLAQEEQILTWALDAQAPAPSPSPSPTIDRHGLDTLQGDAAAAVAGHDGLVLIVGPAGAGKTTMLAAAIADLHRQHRPVYGLAPTAKAARVLERETRMRSDTVAKLLHEWSQPDRPPGDPWRLAPGTSLVVDEAGMLGTPNLAQLVELARDREWRLVLVGDPHQLQAVGRGGLFTELCNTGRTVELQHVHRFTHDWEPAASLKLRHGNPEALDVYERHGRIIPGTLDEHLDTIADHWRTNHRGGATTAITTTTNAHVDKINRHVQGARIDHGDLDPTRWALIAGGEYAHEGDLVATRRNDRQLHTSQGDSVRNRELWTVTHIGDNGELTVTRIGGHGTVTLPTDYAREHVRLGYAATEPGNQSDTVTTSLTLATPATTCRGLYVAMTRGRESNTVLVITDTHDIAEARDVLDRILTADRADTPAVTQRRNLDQQQPRPQRTRAVLQPRCAIPEWFEALRTEVDIELAATRRQHQEAIVRREQHADKLEAAQQQIYAADAVAAPYDNAIRSARRQLDAAMHDRDEAARAVDGAKRFARRPAREALAVAEEHLANAQARFQSALDDAAPAQTARSKAIDAHDAIRDSDFYKTILERWAHHPERIDLLTERQQALAHWRGWAVGEPVTIEQLDTIAHNLHADLVQSGYDRRYAALENAVANWSARHGYDISPQHAQIHDPVRLESPGLELGI